MANRKNALPAYIGASESLERILTTFMSYDSDEVLYRLGKSRSDLRQIETDDEVTAAIDTRRSLAVNTPWRIEHPQREAREFFSAAIKPHIDDILTTAWNAILYGYSVFEVVYLTPDAPDSPTPGRIGIKQIIGVPFEWFVVRPDGQLEFSRESRIADPVRYVLTRNNPSIRKPAGEALLAKAYWPWYFRLHGWRMWARYMEQNAMPLAIGKTMADKSAMLDILRTISSGPVIAINDSDSIELVNSSSSTDFAAFEMACVRRIQRLILGQTLTSGTDGGSGNRALGEVHERVLHEKVRGDIKLISRAAQGVIDRLAALNGIEPGLFVMDDRPPLNIERARMDIDMHIAGMVRFRKEYFVETYQLAPEDFDVPEQPQQQQQSQGQGDDQASLGFSMPVGGLPINERPQSTPGQQHLEDEIGRIVAKMRSPLSNEAINSAIRGSRNKEELKRRLLAAMENAEDVHFIEPLARVIFNATVHGYLTAKREAIDGR